MNQRINLGSWVFERIEGVWYKITTVEADIHGLSVSSAIERLTELAEQFPLGDAHIELDALYGDGYAVSGCAYVVGKFPANEEECWAISQEQKRRNVAEQQEIQRLEEEKKAFLAEILADEYDREIIKKMLEETS